MTAAVVGLLGVIAGALFGGVVKSRADRRLRRVEVVATARIMAIELRSTVVTLLSAKDAGEWWPGEFPVWLWNAKSLAVSYDLDKASLEEVENAYAILRNWNATTRLMRQAGSLGPVPEDIKTALEWDAKKVAIAASILDREEDRLRSKREDERLRIRGGLGVAVVLALGVAVFLLAQTVPDRSDAAVSHSLERALGTGYLADCDAAANEWACQVVATAPGCPLTVTPTAFTPARETTVRRIQGVVVSHVAILGVAPVVSFATQDRCSTVGAQSGIEVSDAGQDLLSAQGEVPVSVPGRAERAARVALQFKGETETRFDQIKNRLGGSD